MIQVSVIIPVYNAIDDVRVCLASLAAGLGAMQSEIILINDCSGEEATTFLREFAKQAIPGVEIRLIEHETNLGYLNSVNQGLELAQGEIAVLLNSDTAIPQDFGSRVLACFAHNPAIGLASPVGSHCGLFSIPMKPGLRGKDVDRMDAFLRDEAPRYPTVILPDGFCFCLRKKMLEQIGLFDPAFSPGYFEEYDLGMRARQAGWRTVLIDNLYVYHKAQASFGSEKNRALVSRNEELFMQRWGKEFKALRSAHPREEHKPRLYAKIYSLPERIWRKGVRFLAQAIPMRERRRRIRKLYN